MKFTIKSQIILIMTITFAVALIILNSLLYQNLNKHIILDGIAQARNIRNILMSTRRVYHHQFITILNQILTQEYRVLFALNGSKGLSIAR